MKKLFLMICTVAAIVTCNSCCGKCDDKQQCDREDQHPAGCCKMSEEERAAKEEMMAKWDKFDELSQQEQVALIAERKACIEHHIARCEAKCADKKAKLATFDSLSIAQQKVLIDEMDAPCCPPRHECGKPCDKPGDQKCCKGDSEHKCCKAEAPQECQKH